jgi:mannose-6-phosphate isomerase-like protein (cupin superfamily)
MDDGMFELTRFPVHLGLGAVAAVLPEMDGTMAWYEHYAQTTAADGREGRLVSMYTFTAPWDSWEVHPEGHELVVCTSGAIVLHQEAPDGSVRTVRLQAGQAAVNEPGVWHTADIRPRAQVGR